MNVYVVFVERSNGLFMNDSYIDSVYFTETSAWNRIEKNVKELTETISNSETIKVSYGEFYNKSFTLAYESDIDIGIYYIKYSIDERKVND